MSTEPDRGQAKLADVLAGLESLILDDDKAAEHDRIVKEAQAVEERQRRADRLEALGIELEPRTHRAVVANTGLKPTTSLCAVQRWLARPDLRPVLVLVGNPGCGKTVSAAWAAATINGSVCWASASEIVRWFSQPFGEAEKLQNKAKRSKLLVIDDIATEGDSTRMCAALIEILQRREQRKTLITTNQDERAWMKRYNDERLHSRLKRAYFVGDKGEDLRGTT